MSPTSPQDRRHHPRVDFWSPLLLNAPDGAEPAALRNLSTAGLACTTSRAFPELTQLKVTLDLPPVVPGEGPGLRLEVTAAVVRCQPLRHGTGRRRYEVALFFTDLSETGRAALTELVRSRLAPAPAVPAAGPAA